MVINDSVEMSRVQEGNVSAKVPLQDEGNCGTRIFEDVIMKEHASLSAAPLRFSPTPHFYALCSCVDCHR